MNVNLTEDDAEEVVHKLTVLHDTEDLLLDYAITAQQAQELIDSVPKAGGEWAVPIWAREIVCGEMQNHAVLLRDIAEDARGEGQRGAALQLCKQAAKFERIFVI